MTTKTIWAGIRERFTVAGLLRQLILSWLLAVTVEVSLLPTALRSLATLDGLAAMSLGRVLLVTLGGTAVLFLLSQFVNTRLAERIAVPLVFGVLAVLSLGASETKGFLGICILLGLILLWFAVRGWNGAPAPAPAADRDGKVYRTVTAAMAVLLCLFICGWTVGRYLTFSTPTFDFGIFSQMFYNMKETGLPTTTVERDGALSHFAVHVSPIYYLMLPFYWLFPSPITLQVLQGVVIASSVIPLWRIGKRHGLSEELRALLCAVMVLYPALSGGTSYDLHENCFLMPLVLWLFDAIDAKNTVLTAIFAVLVLFVKEDAAMYVAVIGLWLLVKSLLTFRKGEGKGLLTGAVLLGASLGWFFLVTGYLARFGDGVMTYRYDNFMYDGSSSLVTVVKSVVLNPMKALFECVDAEKLEYITLTMLPLLGLPLMTRRYERYILLIPYLLVNLMSDYQYQHDVMFQYSFGSAAFLFYLTAVNLGDLKLCKARVIPLVTALAVSAGCFTWAILPTGIDYSKRAVAQAAYYDTIREALDLIPEGAPTATTNTYTAYLSDRAVLYDVKRCKWEQILETEYVALNRSASSNYTKYNSQGKSDGFANLVLRLEENGYELIHEVPGVLVIYHKPQ